MSILRKLASDTALYGLSTIIGRLLNALLGPLHTALFLPNQLAVQVQLYTYAGLALVLYTLGMETAFFRYAREKQDRQQYFNVILSAVLLVSVLISGLLFVFASSVAEFIQYPEHTKLVRWFAIIMAIDGAVAIPFARLRLENKAKKFVGIKFLNILLIVGLNLFFLLVCPAIYNGSLLPALTPLVQQVYNPKAAADYIILANLLANLMYIPLLAKELKGFRFVFNKSLFEPVWVYAFPIFIMNVGAMTNLLFDRAFLQYLLPANFYANRTTEEAIGIYGQCFKLSVFMNLAIQAFKYAAEPFFFTTGQDKNAPPIFAQVMKWFVIVCAVMWVGISLNLDILATFFLRKPIYHEGIVVVPWLLLGFLFLGIYYNLAAWFKLTDKTQYGTYLTLTGAGIVAILNIILVPILGYLGCAIAFASSSFSMMVLCYYYGQKYYPVPYNVTSALGYLATGGVVIYVSSFFQFTNLWVSFGVHSLMLLLIVIVVFLIERKNLPRRP